MPNRLSGETSPYLRQHAENPVEWWPWSPGALAAARAEDKPILLSIGYAACHWCHVMAHESFESESIARLMNERFVNIKVDREERPDLDGIYMQAVQAMTGHGGWPMTVFLTPAGEPFYGGTYFPPEDRHGLPGFARVLTSVSDAWRTRREDVVKATSTLRELYDRVSAPLTPTEPIGTAGLQRAFQSMARAYDRERGGFGGAPKFPHGMALDFALRRWGRDKDPDGIAMVRGSYLAMARGGIYDQVGGGFHRYSVDAHWLVPHFEKMLYDNAILSRLGVHLWQATGDEEVRRVADETLRWTLREMTDESGGFYSSLDADSEGHEGKFYVWSVEELRSVLGPDFEAAAQYWGITPGGNFEGTNILFRARSRRGEQRAGNEAGGGSSEPGTTSTEGAASRERAGTADHDVARWKAALYAARAKRVWPGRDEKVLASWNGLMLRAMAEAARVFGDGAFLAAAMRNAEFLWREMVRDGRVMRSWMRGDARIPGFLEDHASVALGFVAVHQLTFERRWLDRARLLAESCLANYWSRERGLFYDTAHDAEALITRPRDIADNATPAGTSLAVELLLTMAEYFGDEEMRRVADHVLATLVEPMAQHGLMFGHLLGAADMATHGAVELAIAGEPAAEAFHALTRAAAGRYVPSLVLAGGAGDAVRGLALMQGREAGSAGARAYVCRRYACDAPTVDPGELGEQLARASKAELSA